MMRRGGGGGLEGVLEGVLMMKGGVRGLRGLSKMRGSVRGCVRGCVRGLEAYQ